MIVITVENTSYEAYITYQERTVLLEQLYSRWEKMTYYIETSKKALSKFTQSFLQLIAFS